MRVSKKKRGFSLGWKKQCRWRQYLLLLTFFAILRLSNLSNCNLKYKTRLKIILIMWDILYSTFLKFNACDRTLLMPKKVWMKLCKIFEPEKKRTSAKKSKLATTRYVHLKTKTPNLPTKFTKALFLNSYTDNSNCNALRDWCHLHNLKHVRNTHWGVLLLVKLQAFARTLKLDKLEFFLQIVNSRVSGLERLTLVQQSKNK